MRRRRSSMPRAVKLLIDHGSSSGRLAELLHASTMALELNGIANKRALSTHLNGLKSGAITRGLEFALTDTAAETLMNDPCHYCGLKESGRFNGIDRVNNGGGYTPDNTVPCCRWCNRAKGARSVAEFVGWLRWVATGNVPDRSYMEDTPVDTMADVALPNELSEISEEPALPSQKELLWKSDRKAFIAKYIHGIK